MERLQEIQSKYGTYYKSSFDIPRLKRIEKKLFSAKNPIYDKDSPLYKEIVRQREILLDEAWKGKNFQLDADNRNILDGNKV